MKKKIKRVKGEIKKIEKKTKQTAARRSREKKPWKGPYSDEYIQDRSKISHT